MFSNEENEIRFIEALEKIGNEIKYLGNGNASTQMGAIEAHGKCTSEALENVANFVSEAIHDGLIAIAISLEGKEEGEEE